MFKNHNFVLLFFSRFFSVFADAMLFIILLSMLGNFGIRAIGLSIFFIFSTLPAIIFSLPAGAIIERKYLQKVMSITDIIRFVLVGCLALINTIHLTPATIYIFVFAIVLCNIFYIPANSSLLPKIVKKEYLANANSYIQITMLFAKIGSYSVGAWSIKSGLSYSSLLLIVGSFYIISMIMILAVKPYHKNLSTNEPKTIIQDVKAGLAYIKINKLYSKLFQIFGAAWLVGSSVDLYLISYLVEVLERPHEDLYIITTYSLIGIGLGSFISPYLYKRINPKIGLYASSLFFGIIIALFSLKLPLAVLLIGLLFGGFAQGLFLIFINTYLQSNVEEKYLSRVYSLYHFVYTGVSLPGYLLFGYFIDRIGIINTGFIIASYLILIALVTIFYLPSLRNKKEILEERHS